MDSKRDDILTYFEMVVSDEELVDLLVKHMLPPPDNVLTIDVSKPPKREVIKEKKFAR